MHRITRTLLKFSNSEVIGMRTWDGWCPSPRSHSNRKHADTTRVIVLGNTSLDITEFITVMRRLTDEKRKVATQARGSIMGKWRKGFDDVQRSAGEHGRILQ